MRILYIHPSWHKLDLGGVIEDGIGNYSNLVIPELLKQGHEVHLICTSDSSVTETDNLFVHKIDADSGVSSNWKNGLPVSEYFPVIKSCLSHLKFNLIYNNFQANKLIRFLDGIATSGIRVLHFSHANVNSYNLRILSKYTNINVVCCGRLNMESWIVNGPLPQVKGYVPLATDLENVVRNYDDPIVMTEFVIISRIHFSKGIWETLKLAHSCPDIKFKIFGSRVKDDTEVVLNLGTKLFKGSFIEIFKEMVDYLPNVEWVNEFKPERKFLIDYLTKFNGILLSLSPEEAGATIGAEARAFGIPVITLNFPLSNMKYYISEYPVQGHYVKSDYGIIINQLSYNNIESPEIINTIVKDNMLSDLSRLTIRNGLTKVSDHVSKIFELMRL